MTLLLVFLLALGLCFDSFAVSLSAGMGCCTWARGQGVRFAAILALMQGVMPFVGWLLAFRFADQISFWDHWIAFGLLLFLGGKMIFGAIKHTETEPLKSDPFRLRNSLVMGLATSIDALAAGIALALTSIEIIEGSQLSNILMAVLIIAAVTFVASLSGLLLGRRSKGRLGSRSEILGGVILITIGVKVLVEHLA